MWQKMSVLESGSAGPRTDEHQQRLSLTWPLAEGAGHTEGGQSRPSTQVRRAPGTGTFGVPLGLPTAGQRHRLPALGSLATQGSVQQLSSAATHPRQVRCCGHLPQLSPHACLHMNSRFCVAAKCFLMA